MEYEEEMAAGAETDFDTNEDPVPHQIDLPTDETFAATYGQDIEQRSQEEQ